MALAQIYTAIAGDVITAARWNNEFGNIYTNGTDVAFPLTKAVSYAGFTVTYDVAGVSTITSPASTGFVLTVGSKTGTPGANGGLLYIPAASFQDSNTGAGGTAALWSGFSIRIPTLSAGAAGVTTTEAATFYVEGGPTAGANETFTEKLAILTGSGDGQDGKVKFKGDVIIAAEDSRTVTVDAPLTVRSTTSGTPGVDIGTGILVQAESADETPSDIGQLQFRFSDKTAGSEDSYFQVLLRTAGAALAAAYKYVATTAFQTIFTHSNSGDRTYTLPDRTVSFEVANMYVGPTSVGSGSTLSHSGSVHISANQALSGIIFCTDFTLDAGKTITADNDSGGLTIVATGTITINGTINCSGAGMAGGQAPPNASTEAGSNGECGFSQPGGGGGFGNNGSFGGDGGGVVGTVKGGNGGRNGAGAQSAQVNQSFFLHWSMIRGGGGGGGGGSCTGGSSGQGGNGGRGGGSVGLFAPVIVLGAASAINTSGGAGVAGTTNGGGGGGGGAGNFCAACQSYTDNGCTFTLTGGSAGTGTGVGSDGAAGRSGLKQIIIYP